MSNEIVYNREIATQIRGELDMSLDVVSVGCVVPSYIEIHKLGIMTLLIALGIKYSAIMAYRLHANRKH